MNATSQQSVLTTEENGFAQALRLARESRGWSIDEAAQRCLLSDVQVRGLEAADHRAFYSRNYVTQAALRYAALLQVDTGLPGFPAASGATPQALRPSHESVEPQTETPRARPSWRWALGGVVGLGVIVAAAYLLAGRGEPSAVPALPVIAAPAPPTLAVPAPAPVTQAEPAAEPPPADAAVAAAQIQPPAPAPVSVPAVVPVSATPPAPVAVTSGVTTERGRSPMRFHVHAVNAVRFKVTDDSGKVVFAGTLGADERRNLTGQPPFTVETAGAEDLEVFYLGQRKRFGPLANGTAKIRFGDPAATP